MTKINQATLENIRANGVGNEWHKYDNNRLYIDLKDILDIDFYKSGNVRSAYYNNGEKMTNTVANGFRFSKTYVDLDTLEVISTSNILEDEVIAKYGIEDDKEESEDTDESETEDKSNVISGYYVAKAMDFFKRLSAPNADPMPLAKWGSQAKMNDIAIVTATGEVVGAAHRDKSKTAYVDDDTVKKFDLIGNLEIGLAMGDIKARLGEPVVMAKQSDFVGHTSTKINEE